ncbi:DUF1697 domain-containing protein [Paenibacillus sp. GCM10027627]|uniref:DUF1697 domain-containing protein n=1 Tax=unclassified Paenibacillus TaxID=185978 RepID=UPI0036260FCB
MVFVALLRGINVGGNNKIDMKLLKATFERSGMNNVVTYINTGNIIFSNESDSPAELSSILEKAILEDFGLSIKVLIRSKTNIEKIMASLPENWSNDQSMRSDVLYLWDEINTKTVMEQLPFREGIDRAIYVPGAVLWSYDRENAGKSGLNKVVGSKFYSFITIRNVNTARKIYALMQAADH